MVSPATIRPPAKTAEANPAGGAAVERHLAPRRRLLKVKEAAAYLSISPWSLRKLVQSQELPIVRLREGGPWLIDRADLDKLIDARKMYA